METETIAELGTGTDGGGGDGGPGSGGTTTTIVDDATPLADLPTIAEELHKLGLLSGIGEDADGVLNFEPFGTLTRIQGLIMIIRLMGVEEEAMAFDGDNPFTDVPGWAVPYVAYGYAEGITNGISNDLFGPDMHMTCQQFTAFQLRVLGYNEKNGDFEYPGTLLKAVEVNLYTEDVLAELNDGAFLRGDAFIAMVNALMTNMKGSEDKTLLDSLVEGGIITKDEADEFVKAVLF